MASRRPEDDSDTLREAIRGTGLRATTSRVAVLRLLRHSPAPVTHADVCNELERHGWDRATLYRNLLDLTRVALCRRSDLGDHVWRFEATSDRHEAEQRHPHFVCNQCGVVQCLDDVTLVLARGARGPQAIRERTVDVQVKGLCDRCH